MPNEIPELLLLDASRNYRDRFERHFAKFSETDRLATASAAVACANAMGKYVGHMPDNVLFGRPVFSRDEAEKLMTALRDLQTQAEEKGFAPGTAAIIAMQAIASLVLLGSAATSASASTLTAYNCEMTSMGNHMEILLQLHQAAAV